VFPSRLYTFLCTNVIWCIQTLYFVLQSIMALSEFWKVLWSTFIMLKGTLILSWYRVSFLALTRPGREGDHPPPSSVERQKIYSCTSPSPPPRAFMAYFGVTGTIVICAATPVPSLCEVPLE